MLEVLPSDGQTFRYRVFGALSTEDLRNFYAAVDRQYQRYGRLDAQVEARGFKGYSDFKAVLTFLRHEPALALKFRTYQLTSNQAWLRRLVAVAGWFVPGIEVVVRPLPGMSP